MSHMKLNINTALAAVPVNLLPFVLKSDGTTISAAVAYNAAGMSLQWNFMTMDGVFTQTDVIPTTAGIHDWVILGSGMYAIEIPATGGTINNNAFGFGWFSGETTAEVPFAGPVIEFDELPERGTLQAGGTGTCTLAAGAGTVQKGKTIVFTTGTSAGNSSIIASDPAAGVITLVNSSLVVGVGDYKILPMWSSVIDATNPIDANAVQANGGQIYGAGTSGDLWRGTP